jgi:hypothetical protein
VRSGPRLCLAAAIGALTLASDAAAQTSSSDSTPTQIWGDVILDFPKGKRWLFETGFQPQVQVSGGKWWSMEVTPLTEYYPAPWIDLVGETAFAYTRQADDVDSVELTPRLGFRLNILNDFRERGHLPDPAPLHRVRIGTLVRFEYRNLWYNDDSPSEHEWRFRVRLQAKVGINHADLAENCSLYGIVDGEGFIPLGEGVSERYASKVRTRAGLGFRLSYRTRFEVLYVRDWHRDSPGAPKAPTTNSVDLRLNLYF